MASELSHPEQAFDKALYLLDQDEGEKAEALLLLVIEAARVARDPVLLARALCVLGEWLQEQRRVAEARVYLREVLELQVPEPDLIAYEQRRARHLLDATAVVLAQEATTASNKALKLTRPVEVGASQLSASVRRTRIEWRDHRPSDR